ncbi:MAG TPA: LamG-like jellyroll fold domain-containing protein [Sedimentisphaerales bacterium]|nr:LamG-like jellyroll fold domain-containing protein [Sedimentisphaerales bacterium]
MRRVLFLVVAAVLLASGAAQAQMFDITNPGDPVVGVPNDNNWPAAEAPPRAIDNVIAGAKYLCFKTSFIPDAATGAGGFRVTPSGPKVVVKALNFASANDAVERDPIRFRLSGSDVSIDGPYTVIAEGDIAAFNATTAYARNTWIPAPIPIVNKKAYKHYELMFTELRNRTAANSVQIGEVEFLSDGSLPGSAGGESPKSGTVDVPRDVVLGWLPGDMAATRDVYFGTSFEDVNTASRSSSKGVLLSQDQTEVSYDPEGLLEYGQTYYWRIDEVNSAPDYTIYKGDVWSFTVEPFAYPIQNITATASSQSRADTGPENTVNGSGLNAGDQHSTELTQMWMSGNNKPHWVQYEFDKVYKLDELWVWNSNQIVEAFVGFGAKDVTIEYSVDGAAWTALEGAHEFARASGAATYAANTFVDFGGVQAKFVKLTINSNWGGIAQQASLSEVRFFYVPVQAFGSKPADDATAVSVTASLEWRPGREATSHKVFFGADGAAVAAGTAAASTVTQNSFTPTAMNLDTEYFWRVDAVGNTGTYAGDVWSFKTQEYLVVDDFEAYTDVEGSRIYEAWVDGITTGASGSQVGYNDAPFAEKTIIRGGNQSMPILYDNSKFALAEAQITLGSAQNWSARGIKTLAIHFAGAAGNTGQLYLKINSTKVAYNGAAADLTRAVWQAWNIDLSTVGNVSSVRTLTIGIEGAGAKGTLYIDDIRLYPKAPQFITPANPGNANLVGLWTLDGNTNDTSGRGNNGTVTGGTASWVPGAVGQAMEFTNGQTFVDCGRNASLNLTDAVTVTAWIRMGFTAGDRKIASNQDGTTGGYKIGLFTNNKVEFEVRTSANAGTLNRNAAGGAVLQQDVWYHVAGVYSKGEFMRTYVFGNLDREMATTAVLGASTGPFKLGCGESTTNYFWLGALDDVRVYNRVLSQEELLFVMGQTQPVAKPF